MDRAVSDVLGYILIFGLILSSVALVTVGGSNSLNTVRDAERFENAQRVFDVLDENVEDHLETGINSRGTEIRLADAGLDFGESVALNVSVDGHGYNATVTEPLVYRQSSARQIRYVAGATVRQDRGYAQVTNRPPLRIDDEESLVTFVRTRGRDSGISGSGRILVRTRLATQSIHEYSGEAPYTVTINVTTDQADRAEAWKRWLETESGTTFTVRDGTDSDGDSINIVSNDGDPIETDRLYVRTVIIDVFLD